MTRRHACTWIILLVCLGILGCPPAPVPTEPTGTASGQGTSPTQPTSLRARVLEAIDLVRSRELEPVHGFWTVFHGIVGLGPEVMLHDRKGGRRLRALDYIREGGDLPGLKFEEKAEGLDVLNATDDDRFYAQGHQDQFVAEMAQWGVPIDLEFRVHGRPPTFRAFVRYTKAPASIAKKQELGWAILILAEYEGTDFAWTNKFGEALTFEDLIRYEVESPMDPEESVRVGQLPLACGGTHRLFGLSWAWHVHRQRGGARTGVWAQVADQTAHWKQTAKRLQNPDGSFSTNWFVGRSSESDRGLRLTTTGHTLEWLALALSDEELREPWVEESVRYLANLILDMRNEAVEGGTLYHAIHGLIIYYARVWGTEALGPNTPYLRLLPEWKQVGRAAGWDRPAARR